MKKVSKDILTGTVSPEFLKMRFKIYCESCSNTFKSRFNWKYFLQIFDDAGDLVKEDELPTNTALKMIEKFNLHSHFDTYESRIFS